MLAAVELAPAVVVSALAVHAFVSSRAIRHEAIADLAPDAIQPGGIGLPGLAGLDFAGKPVAFRALTSADRFAVFVMRYRSVAADCSYWDAVQLRLARAVPPVFLAAFCRGPGCGRLAARRARYPVIDYASIPVLQRLLVLDQAGAVMEVNRQARVLALLHWRGLPVPRISKLLAAVKH
jgi:hypothetical protein